MKQGINEKILNRIMGLNKMASNRIASNLKGDKPFNKEKIDPQLLIWAIDNIGFEDLQELRMEFGDEAMGRLRYDAYLMEERRRNA